MAHAAMRQVVLRSIVPIRTGKRADGDVVVLHHA